MPHYQLQIEIDEELQQSAFAAIQALGLTPQQWILNQLRSLTDETTYLLNHPQNAKHLQESIQQYQAGLASIRELTHE